MALVSGYLPKANPLLQSCVLAQGIQRPSPPLPFSLETESQQMISNSGLWMAFFAFGSVLSCTHIIILNITSWEGIPILQTKEQRWSSSLLYNKEASKDELNLISGQFNLDATEKTTNLSGDSWIHSCWRWIHRLIVPSGFSLVKNGTLNHEL